MSGRHGGWRRSRSTDVDRQLLALAVPALGALVAEPIYVLTDTAIVGRLGTEPLAGLSIASAILLTGYSVFLFLAYGTTAAVSRHRGAGDERAAAHQAVQGLWLAAGIGVLLAVAGWAGGRSIIGLLGGRGAVAEQAWTYLAVSLFGLPALLISLAGVGYLRAARDTTTPLLVALGTAVGNGVLEAVLIFGFDRGIGASAFSTVLAQSAAAAVYVWRVAGAARALGAVLRPHLTQLGRLLVVGVHLLVRTAALRGAMVLGVAVAARIGTEELAAYEIGFQFWSLTALALDAVAIAAQILVGHALGAGDARGARRLGRRSMLLSTVAGAGLGVVLITARTPLVAIFSHDPAVRQLAASSVLIVGAMMPVNGLAFALDGILIGAGDERFLAGAMAVAFCGYAAAALAVRLSGAGLSWLWAAMALLMVERWLLLHWRFRGDRWLVVGATRLARAAAPPT